MQAALIAVLFTLVFTPPQLPPSAQLAVSFADPFGYPVVIAENGTYTAAFSSWLQLWALNEAIAIVDGSEFNISGRQLVSTELEPGLHTVILKGNSSVLYVQIYVLTFEEQAKYELSKSAQQGDPRRKKYVYAVISAVAMVAAGIDLGVRLRLRRAPKVEEERSLCLQKLSSEEELYGTYCTQLGGGS